MGRIKNEINRRLGRTPHPQLRHNQAEAKPLTPAEMDKFARAVVRDYGETLVLLGKE